MQTKKIYFLILHGLSGLKTKLTMCIKAIGNMKYEQKAQNAQNVYRNIQTQRSVQNSKVAASYGNQYENLLIKNCVCDHL